MHLSTHLMSCAAAVLLLLSACGGSQPPAPTATGLQVSEGWVRAMPPGSKVAAGYLELHNPGSKTLRVTALRSPVAASVEAHDMTMENGQMRMRETALVLAPGERLALQPGGRHLMLMGVLQPLAEGQTVALMIELDDGTSQSLELPVKTWAPAADEHVH